MTGMKEGPGDDPFADDSDDALDSENENEAQSKPATETNSESKTSTMSTNEIPYIIGRQTVKEDRNNRLTYFARDEYDKAEDQLHQAVADELDTRQKEVSLTDVREAVIAVAAEHPDEVADKLREWGIEHTL